MAKKKKQGSRSVKTKAGKGWGRGMTGTIKEKAGCGRNMGKC